MWRASQCCRPVTDDRAGRQYFAQLASEEGLRRTVRIRIFTIPREEAEECVRVLCSSRPQKVGGRGRAWVETHVGRLAGDL